jgi:hypothetical protein
MMAGDLDPRDVLADLFGSGDFPPEILLDPLHAAEVVVQRCMTLVSSSRRRDQSDASTNLPTNRR